MNRSSIAIILFIILVIVIAGFIITRKPAGETKTENNAEVVVSAGPGTANPVDGLEELKEKLNELNETDRVETRVETYVVDGNPSLTLVGTAIEQFLDIAIATLKQPLVNESLKKTFKDNGNIDVIKNLIISIGKEVVSSINDNQLLACARPFDCEYVSASGGPIKCVGHDEPFEHSSLAQKYVMNDKEWKSEKTSDCDRYIPVTNSIQNIKDRVKNKIASELLDPTKQELLYNTIVNLGKNNIDFFGKHIVHTSIAVKSRGNPFDEGGEFFEHIPIDKFGVLLQKNINRLSEDGTPSDTPTPPPFRDDGLQIVRGINEVKGEADTARKMANIPS
jgi:hypothetical protein